MSDITAFLLARIADDEAIARAVIAERDRIAWRPGAKPTPGMDIWRDVDAQVPHVAVDAERVIVDCQARVRIVERHPCDDCGAGNDPCDTLRLLAEPYRTHQNYDETWRP